MRRACAMGMAVWVWSAGVAAARAETTAKDLVPMEVLGLVTCKGLNKTADRIDPVQPTEQFWTTDKQVVSIVRFQHVLKQHAVRWRWYGPDGKLYVESADLPVTPTGKYHRLFYGTHRVLVAGERAMLYTGQWKVVVYLNGAVAATGSFTLAVPRSAP